MTQFHPPFPFMLFCLVAIKCDQEQFSFRRQRELNLWSMFVIIMSDARPVQISSRPKGRPNVLIDLPQPLYVLSNETQVEVQSPVQLQLHPSVHNAREILRTPCTAVVTIEGIFAFHVANTGTIQNTMDVIADQLETFHGVPCDKLCVPLNMDETPDYHFMVMPTRLHQVDFPTLTEVDSHTGSVIRLTPGSQSCILPGVYYLKNGMIFLSLPFLVSRFLSMMFNFGRKRPMDSNPVRLLGHVDGAVTN